MKTLTQTLTILLSLSLFSVYVPGQKTPANQKAKRDVGDIVGKWEGGVIVGSSGMRITLELKNEGNKIVGQIKNPHGTWTVTDAKFSGGKWTIVWRTPEDTTGKMIGAVKDNKLSGDWDFSPNFIGTFELTKATSTAK